MFLHRCLRECPTGWLCKETGSVYTTAVGAFKALARDAASIDRPVVVTLITWEPTTIVGSLVVAAFTS